MSGEPNLWKESPQYSNIFNVLLTPIISKVNNIGKHVRKPIIVMDNIWFSTYENRNSGIKEVNVITLIRQWWAGNWAVKSVIDKSHSLKQIPQWKITPVSCCKKNSVFALQYQSLLLFSNSCHRALKAAVPLMFTFEALLEVILVGN